MVKVAYYRAFQNDDRNGQVLFGGYWRCHVVPARASTETAILTAIDATDSRVQQPSRMELLESEGCLAAQVGPNWIVFSSDGKTLADASATVTAEWSGRIVVADLAQATDCSLSVRATEIRLKPTKAGTICVPEAELSAGDILRSPQQ